jgi:DNA-binding transcriptional ArsR family regulator
VELTECARLAAGEIAARFDISAPSISRHLSILLDAGLIDQRRLANRLLWRLRPETLVNTLSAFLGSVCPTQVAQRRGARGLPVDDAALVDRLEEQWREADDHLQHHPEKSYGFDRDQLYEDRVGRRRRE